jgi:hypothetical protein
MPNELVKVSSARVPATGVEETLPVLVERAGGAARFAWDGTDQEFSAILDHLESTTGFGFFLVSIPKSDSRTSPSSSSSSRTRRESRSASLF